VETLRGRHSLRLAFTVLLTIGLLAVFLFRAPLKEVREALASVHLGWALSAVLLALASYGLRGLRWGLILRPVGRVPAFTLIGSTAAGFAASTLLPARAGELVRALVLSARTRISVGASVASIVTERLVDLATILAMFAVAAALSGGRVSAGALTMLLPAAGLAFAALLAGLVLVLVLLRRRDRTVEALARLAPRRFRDRCARLLHHLMDGLGVLRQPRQWFPLAVWSLALWSMIVCQLVVLAWAFGIQLDLVQGVLVVAVSIVGLSVPTPAGVGGFHAATQFALINLLAVDPAAATAFALVHHAVCFFPITVVGLAYLSRVGFSLAAVRTEVEAGAATVPAVE
jgi:hypothetical protein